MNNRDYIMCLFYFIKFNVIEFVFSQIMPTAHRSLWLSFNNKRRTVHRWHLFRWSTPFLTTPPSHWRRKNNAYVSSRNTTQICTLNTLRRSSRAGLIEKLCQNQCAYKIFSIEMPKNLCYWLIVHKNCFLFT